MQSVGHAGDALVGLQGFKRAARTLAKPDAQEGVGLAKDAILDGLRHAADAGIAQQDVEQPIANSQRHFCARLSAGGAVVGPVVGRAVARGAVHDGELEVTGA
jgi:hypothetical protein